jgi:hypothetical protein
MAAVGGHLRSQQIHIFMYLDDWLVKKVETWEFVGMHLADLRWTPSPPHGGLEWLILVFPSWNEIFPCIHWEVSSLILGGDLRLLQTSKVRSADNKFVKYCTYVKYFRRGKKIIRKRCYRISTTRSGRPGFLEQTPAVVVPFYERSQKLNFDPFCPGCLICVFDVDQRTWIF